MQVKDALNLINNFAPNGLAQSWDNTGLLVGKPSAEISKILLTLDVTEAAVEKAIKTKANLIVAHHPLIFKGLKKLTNPLILKVIENKINVICAHTNLDSVTNGVNTALAESLELNNLQFLNNDTNAKWYKIEVFVPENSMQKVANAVCSAGAGKIENYSNCYSYQNSTGNFYAEENSKPVIGNLQQNNIVQEQKLEFMCDSFNLGQVLANLKQNHPYQTPVYYVHELNQNNPSYGMGFVGQSNHDFTLTEFAEFVKQKLNAKFVKIWQPNGNVKINKVAVCGGSGSSFLSQAKAKADVFVSGDFTYHTILDSSLPLIDAGHFYTEYPVLKKLQNLLKPLNCEIEFLTLNEHEIKNLSVI